MVLLPLFAQIRSGKDETNDVGIKTEFHMVVGIELAVDIKPD